MDAPERIWTASTEGKCHVGFDTPSMNYTNEYIRADLTASYLAELVEALRWYGEQSRLACLIHSEGDAGRHAISADGGKHPNPYVCGATESYEHGDDQPVVAYVVGMSNAANRRFIAFTRQWVPEAAASIAALTAQVAENRISEPHDPGDFVGDIYFGHPVKTTMGTHRWTGSEWVKLPSETEVLIGLLADARSERDALRAKLARIASAWPIVRDADCSGGTLASAMDEIEAAISDGAADE